MLPCVRGGHTHSLNSYLMAEGSAKSLQKSPRAKSDAGGGQLLKIIRALDEKVIGRKIALNRPVERFDVLADAAHQVFVVLTLNLR